MAQFAGYAKRPESKWPYVLLAAVLLFVLVVVLPMISMLGDFVSKKMKEKPASTSSTTRLDRARRGLAASTLGARTTTNEAENPIVSKEAIALEKVSNPSATVEAMVFTSSLTAGNLPTDNLKNIPKTKQEKLYLYNKINNYSGTLRHVWVSPKGEVYADIKISIYHQPANIWSYVSLYNKEAGEWEAQVRDANNNILASKKILITDN